MSALLIALVVAGLLQQAPTLGAELLKRHLPVPPDAPDLDQPITSYSLLDDDRGFVIAYYAVEPDGLLHELRMRAFDARSRTWRTKQFPEPIGSVLSIQRHAGWPLVAIRDAAPGPVGNAGPQARARWLAGAHAGRWAGRVPAQHGAFRSGACRGPCAV